MVFSLHSLPKTQIETDFYRILLCLASQPAMLSTRKGRDYREDMDVAAAIGAATEADIAAAAIAAVAEAREAKEAKTEAMP